ncbi:mitogen-activated protein kinase kinase kinase ANP1 isoform X9 [Aegilops tauschii subsp. strangulata]|uniref:mitogen-activated protein kinase kinase kinase ANP1 isoform X9 n=1 Tax=Aegilops tauschii subsp. strangulata TaxID=200361 RepID=UPI003CC886C5
MRLIKMNKEVTVKEEELGAAKDVDDQPLCHKHGSLLNYLHCLHTAVSEQRRPTQFGCRRTKRSTHQEVMLFPTTTAKAHIRELEEEVKLLKNLSHPNIMRYLGTVREEDTLNILLEFVPGGSIQSLLGKLGSFPEAVVRKYTRQILQGLEYLHSNAIIHRDIKGANILVDNKGCIKLANFGASKQVAKLGLMNKGAGHLRTAYVCDSALGLKRQ